MVWRPRSAPGLMAVLDVILPFALAIGWGLWELWKLRRK